jgi:hypothetical protein
VISLDSGQQPRGALQKRMRAGTTENYLEYQIRVPSNVGFADSGTCAPSNREWSFAQRLSLGPVFAAAGGSLDVRLCGYVNTPQAAAAPSALPFTDIVVMTVTF